MKTIKRFFTDKRFIYGSGSVALIAGFIAVVVLINIIVGVLSDKLTLKIDLTENKIFRLSEETLKVIDGIDRDIDVILFETTGSSDEQTKELLERYVNRSAHLRMRTADPVRDPMSAQKYNTLGTSVSVGSIVLDIGAKFRLISPSELRGYNAYTQQNDQFQAENKLTTALISLLRAAEISVAFTDGHGESDKSAARQLLEDEDIKAQKVPTLTDGFSADYDLFILSAPKTDFTAEEIDGMDAYLKTGKSVQVYFDADTPHLERLERYLYDNGIEVNRNIVAETDNSRVLYNTPLCFVPEVKAHDITKPIVDNNLYVVVYGTRSLTRLWDEKNSVKLETLIASTAKAAAQTAEGAIANGPFDLAVLATRSDESGAAGKIMVMGSSLFIDEQFLNTNKDFFLSSVSWQAEDKAPVSIRPKSLSSSRLEMTQQDFIIWLLVILIFIPVIILALGLATWLRRRHL